MELQLTANSRFYISKGSRLHAGARSYRARLPSQRYTRLATIQVRYLAEKRNIRPLAAVGKSLNWFPPYVYDFQA